MEDAGWKPIKSTDKDSKFYFIGNKEESDELFSDNESKYEREVRAKKRLTITNSWIAIYYILFFFTGQNRSVFFNVKNAFLTPGILDKHGDSFRRAFLFDINYLLRPIKKETTATKITAPITEGTIAIPARVSPQ